MPSEEHVQCSHLLLAALDTHLEHRLCLVVSGGEWLHVGGVSCNVTYRVLFTKRFMVSASGASSKVLGALVKATLQSRANWTVADWMPSSRQRAWHTTATKTQCCRDGHACVLYEARHENVVPKTEFTIMTWCWSHLHCNRRHTTPQHQLTILHHNVTGVKYTQRSP